MENVDPIAEKLNISPNFVDLEANLKDVKPPEKDAIEIIFVEDLPSDLLCKKCGQVFRLPQQLTCGHRLCGSCLDGLHTCPECSALIEYDKVKLDKASQRRIQRLAVQCTFHDNGCPWKGELKQLESHALSCDYADIVCPRGCGIIYPKKEEKKHLEDECLKKTQACPHCDKIITVKGLKAHLKVCPSMLIDCPNNCGLFQKPRAEISDHLLECPKAGSICPFGEFGCQYSGGRENLQKHIKDQPVKHLSFLCDAVLDLKALLATVQLNAEKLSRNMEVLTTKILSLEKLYGAQFIWRIDEVQEKFNDAKSGARTIIFSPPFLSGRHGYKLLLSVALFGDGPVRGKQLSIFIAIMKGEYDALLPWPFVHKITLTLMDQNPEIEKRKHLAYVVKPYASVENGVFLDRPVGERNASFGAQSFCDIDLVNDYVIDDTMFIKCNIDTENMIVL